MKIQSDLSSLCAPRTSRRSLKRLRSQRQRRGFSYTTLVCCPTSQYSVTTRQLVQRSKVSCDKIIVFCLIMYVCTFLSIWSVYWNWCMKFSMNPAEHRSLPHQRRHHSQSRNSGLILQNSQQPIHYLFTVFVVISSPYYARETQISSS